MSLEPNVEVMKIRIELQLNWLIEYRERKCSESNESQSESSYDKLITK